MYRIYNVNIGDDMKNDSVKGIIQLVLGVLVCYVLENYFFFLLSKVGLNFSGNMYVIMNVVRYGLACIIVYILYHAKIRSSRNKFTKSIITSIVFSVGSFVLLVFVNFILHKAIGTFHPIEGYGLSNYFSSSFNVWTALSILLNVFFKPFLVIVLFCLGLSNIIRKVWPTAIISGVLFAIMYALNINAAFPVAIWYGIIPGAIIALATYFYKTTQNIRMVYIAYVLYVSCGIYVLRYFL